jgi:predicted PurR-regulated permease PerM
MPRRFTVELSPVSADSGNSPAVEEAKPEEAAVMAAAPIRSHRIELATAILAGFAFVAALYLARGFVVPLLIGILASYALHPLVDWLEKYRVPRTIGAIVVLGSLVGGLAWIAFSMSDDAKALIDKLPEAAHNMRMELSVKRSGGPSTLQNIQDIAHELQGAAADVGAHPSSPDKPAVRTVAVQPAESTWLRDYTLAQSALLATVAAQAPIVLLLTYFLLASGAHFRRKLLQIVGPSLSRKKDAVRILEEIDTQVQRYLLTVVASNLMVAVCTWLTFLALGLDQAGVWGLAAGVFHFVPYLGPGVIAIGSGVAAYLQFGSLVHGLAVAALSMVVSGLIGVTFMTWLQSRFARVNAAVLFIVLLFFGWLWGAWGLLLGAPLLAITKVVFDRVEALKPVGELIGR